MRRYIKPELFVIELVAVELVATSFNTPEDGKDNVTAGSKRIRGEWGDLWK